MDAILKAFPVLLIMACLGPMANAQAQSTNDGGMRTAVFGPSKVAVPASHSHARLKTLFSNLSDYTYGTYFCCGGAIISGPAAQHSFGELWLALPVTPKENFTLIRIDAPFSTLDGAPSIAVWVAADAGGVPGDTIAGPVDVKTLPLGGCCGLSTVAFEHVSLTQGMQYWIVVGTDSNSMDSNDIWPFNTTDMRPHPVAIYSNGAWRAEVGLLPAIGIFGDR